MGIKVLHNDTSFNTLASSSTFDVANYLMFLLVS